MCSYRKVDKIVNSFSSDLIAAVSRGKVVTLKQFLVGLGLHNITGLKTPIKILSHLGHCIDYNLVCEVETVQAEMNLKALEEIVVGSNVNETCETEGQLTYWWADNFNQTIETQTGHGAIDTTHIVEFSESQRIVPVQVVFRILCYAPLSLVLSDWDVVFCVPYVIIPD